MRETLDLVRISLGDFLTPLADESLSDAQCFCDGRLGAKMLNYVSSSHGSGQYPIGIGLSITGNTTPVECPLMETRGERLKRLREDRNLSQTQLAKAIGVTKANVSKWEARAAPNIDLDVFFNLAKFFGIDPQELATGHPLVALKRPDISPGQLALIRAYSDLPAEIRLPIRSLIETLAVARNERYAAWSREEADRAHKRDSKKPQKA